MLWCISEVNINISPLTVQLSFDTEDKSITGVNHFERAALQHWHTPPQVKQPSVQVQE